MTKNKIFLLLRFLSILILLMLTLLFMLDRFASKDATIPAKIIQEFPVEYEDHRQWVIKWHEGYEPPESNEFEVLHLDRERRLGLILLQEDIEVREWYIEWMLREDIDYLEPDHALKIGTGTETKVDLSEEFFRSFQTYLDQIQAPKAWELVKENNEIVIAILDTGIDLEHPDLQDNLVPGINLIDSSLPPDDDHGHGTQLAGVVGGTGNELGITGLLWSTNIMPVKVLPEEGEGSPFIVSQGIYQAIDRGASIILLSLGSPIFSQTLQEAVLYAEEQGVLIVAATGNEGGRVNYPAAFPTVLAVGAVNLSDEPVLYSNAGPEVHVVAPGTVYTTTLDGGYLYTTGTSLSAAQVAGMAGLILKRYPDLKPYQLRNHIVYTAVDVHEKGWDPRTGHGRINVWKAVSTPPVADIYESNNSIAQAAPFPIESMLSAQLKDQEDVDWYHIELPYDGIITLQVDLERKLKRGMDIIFFSSEDEDNNKYSYTVLDSRSIRVPVKKGSSYMKVRFHEDEQDRRSLNYHIVSSFTIYADKQEPNSTKEHAYPLKGDGSQLVGTFHRDNVQDWYYIDIPQQGELDIHVSVDTLRLDPVLYFERPDGSSIRVDDGSVATNQEERLITDVEQGRYYIRLHHYYDNKVNGEYFLRVTYRPYFEDQYEPNDTLDQAVRLYFSQALQASIQTLVDEDWFRVRVLEERFINFQAYHLPSNVGLNMELYNEDKELVALKVQKRNEDEIRIGEKLKPGTYYIRITAGKAFPFDSYHLRASQQEVTGGYRDMPQALLQSSLEQMTESGVFKGLGEYLAQPNEPVSREVVAQTLLRLYAMDKSRKIHFNDFAYRHWTYEPLYRILGAGVTNDVESGTFALSKSLSRAEAAIIFDRFIQLDPYFRSKHYSLPPYSDIDFKHWSHFSIMRLAQMGVMTGDEKGRFYPNAPLTRGEFVSIIQRIEEQRYDYSIFNQEDVGDVKKE